MTTPEAAPACPFHGARKSAPADDASTPALERCGDTWHVRGLEHVRTVLRAEGTRQAGFNAESVGALRMRPPILFQDGPEHRAQRAAIARFFTPAAVSGRYREMMEELADALVGELKRRGRADVSQLSVRLAVEVAAKVVGLEASSGLTRRLEAFFATPPAQGPRAQRLLSGLLGQLRVLHFYLCDVRPAIAARRRAPQEDVISHLLGKGYGGGEILAECLTYAAAGMATTREFIVMAALHLLEDDGLRARYLTADEPERHRLLGEILRLEPVVGALYRRTTQELVLEDAGVSVRIPAGSRVKLSVRAANADPALEPEPLALCPERPLPKGVQPPVMSFGDGVHRCPGATLALQESDIFLTRLLVLPLRVVRTPELTHNPLIESYELRGLEVALA